MPRRVVQTDLPAQPDEAVPDLLDEPAADADEPTDDAGERRPPTNGDLARIFHEMGDILEVKGEIKFKTVAYHRAADAIARAPFDVAAAYAAGDRRPIPGVGQAIGDKIVELATTGHMACLRAPPRGDPGQPRRPAADPGRRAADGAHRLRGPRRGVARGPAPGRRGRHAPRAEGHLGQHRTADPRGHRAARVAPPAPPAQPGPGDLRRPRAHARRHARRRADRAGGVAPPAQGDHRRPRPARRDRRPGRRRRPVHGSRAGRPGHRRRAARRAASG